MLNKSLAVLSICALYLLSGGSYAAFVSFQTSTTASPSTCPQGTGVPGDGCSGAQAIGHGTIVNANLANAHQVIALNIVAGSGYANGTYTWTSSGGGCSTNASGTVTVAGGSLGFLTPGYVNLYGGTAGYTITNPGANCTSRPTIAIPAGAGAGSGASIIPTVYQVTAHNCTSVTACNSSVGANWNVAGVDYPVGYDTTLTLSDPTAGGLPSGCSYSSGAVTCSSGTPTLNGYDFTLHGTALVLTGGIITVTNNKFGCVGLQEISTSGTGTYVIKYNTFSGNSSRGTAGCFSTGQTAAVNMSNTGGSVTLQYNFCQYQDEKCYNVANGGTSGSPFVLTEQYDFNYDFGICGLSSLSTGPCTGHGEAEYFYPGNSSKTLQNTQQFNVNLLDFNLNGSFNNTAPAAIEADGGIQASPLAEFNLDLAQGNQIYTGNNNTAQVASSASYCGSQEGGSYTGSPAFKNNLLDYSGAFNAYNLTANTCQSEFTFGDFNAGTGNACTAMTCN